ncbi:MAG: hypothetical protein AAFO82_16415, partial [Bacteroidota bacterium]
SGTNSPVNNIVNGIYRKGNVGIGINTPLSNLSINGQGDSRFGAYVTAPGQANGATGLFSEMPAINGFSDWNRAVVGSITSGTGYAIGLQGYSYNPIPSNQGRSYGVFAQAGNANINYGVYSTLLGSNRGAAVFGNAIVADSDPSILFDGKWAAYFLGRGYFSDNLGIGTNNPLSKLSINGDGNSRFGLYITSPSQGNGSSGIRVEMPTNIGFADRNVGVTSSIESGYGYTTGLYGVAITSNASSNGRAYGVRGDAANADLNFGLYGQLSGQNRGAGLFAVDNIKHPVYSEIIDGTWAGYFLGDVHMSDRLAIGTTKMPASLGNFNLSDYQLYVCGGILAEELLLPNITWCDYVFESDYELTSLEDVKSHIEEKGYLHNTPSAETVEKEGLKVADMTVNQQEKIEEIFLHLIKMNEELKQLRAENLALKKQLRKITNSKEW